MDAVARPQDPRERAILPPEGVPLTFRVALVGDRIAAVLLDGAILVAAVFVLVLMLLFLDDFSLTGWSAAFLGLAIFALRNGYFVAFEHAWRGQTPGKRVFGLMVMDAGGGPLTSEAIWARNLTREVECFLPLVVLANPALMSGGPAAVRLAAVAWLLVLMLLPLFNRDHRRVGDLLAGTLVVEAPHATLLPDLAHAEGIARTTIGHFTRAELDVYGVYELQVLEDLLRRESPGSEALATVAHSIRTRLGRADPGAWAPELRAPHDFLTAFYRAQRAQLERDLLLGQVRRRKQERRPERRA
jgi:uncharacterized RDD family membrane protein YckC